MTLKNCVIECSCGTSIFYTTTDVDKVVCKCKKEIEITSMDKLFFVGNVNTGFSESSVLE